MITISAKELLTTICRIKNKSQRDVSKLIGIGPQLLNQKVNGGMLKLTEMCRICDAAGLQLALFDMSKSKRVPFDTDTFGASDNGVRYDDAEGLLALIGLEVRLVDSSSKRIIQPSTGGYGRRVRAWVDSEEYDTLKANAIATGLNTECYKFGGTEKYNVNDPRELYKTETGKWFFAVFGDTRNDDAIVPCTEEEAARFIEEHGAIE